MNRKEFINVVCFTCLVWLSMPHGFAQDVWWPSQREPKEIFVCDIADHQDVRELNLGQSVSGVAAQALNQGEYDKGVWVMNQNPNYKVYYRSLIERLSACESGNYPVWALVERLWNDGIIKGYILYDYDRADNSINLATSFAGLYRAVLVDVTQEQRAKQMGLTKLRDVVHEAFDSAVLDTLMEALNPNLLVLMDPRVPNNRDYAIAHRGLVYYGTGGLFPRLLTWVKPLSLVIGWNEGDEFEHIAPCSKHGLINTVTDWCSNLAMLSIPARTSPGKLRTVDPRTIDWSDKHHHHAFVMSDGDNMQWAFGNFVSSADYWANPNNTSLRMSFTSCVVNLAVAARDVYNHLLAHQPDHVSVIEYGAGYFYPDLFASVLPDPEEWLRKYAVMINAQLKKTGVRVFGFICKDLSSEAAQQAYRIFAEELDGIVGMIAVQYSPYNGGHGSVYWVKNRHGINIPVVTAKYQLWASLDRKGSGGPEAIATWINNDSRTESPNSTDDPSWTIVHAWSQFIDSEAGNQVERGITPVKWVNSRLSSAIKLVNIEELLWRIRMQYHPYETTRIIQALNN